MCMFSRSIVLFSVILSKRSGLCHPCAVDFLEDAQLILSWISEWVCVGVFLAAEHARTLNLVWWDVTLWPTLWPSALTASTCWKRVFGEGISFSITRRILVDTFMHSYRRPVDSLLRLKNTEYSRISRAILLNSRYYLTHEIVGGAYRKWPS